MRVKVAVVDYDLFTFTIYSHRTTVIVLKIFPASHELTRKKKAWKKSLKITISFGYESRKFLLTAML